jgi:hypothetical protein
VWGRVFGSCVGGVFGNRVWIKGRWMKLHIEELKILLGAQIKEDVMGRARNVHVSGKKCICNFRLLIFTRSSM